MSTSETSEQFTSLADDRTLTDTIVGLEEHEGHGRKRQADGQDPPDSELRHESLRDRRKGDGRHRQPDVGDPGLERRVVQDLLHVQRQQKEL